MTETKPWTESQIAALTANVDRKIAVMRFELWELFRDQHPDIDPEEMTDEQTAKWDAYSTPIINDYRARRLAAIAELNTGVGQDSKL